MKNCLLAKSRNEIKEKILILFKSIMQQKTIFIMSIITFVLSCIFICTKRKVFMHSACGTMLAILCLQSIILFTQDFSVAKNILFKVFREY